jgi:hypothetical protein
MTIVRKGRVYRFSPCLWDIADPSPAHPKPGALVRVIHPHGCPRPNTMGHCHIETLDGRFAGLVSCNSLVRR